MLGNINQNSIVKILDKDSLQQASKMAGNSFIKLNNLWPKLGINKQMATDFIKFKLQNSVKDYLSSVIFYKGNVKGVVVVKDLYDYVNIDNNSTYGQQKFIKLNYYGNMLQKQIFKNINKRGVQCYAVYGIIDQSIAKMGYSIKFWQIQIIYLFSLGYKYLYTRLTTKASLMILLKLGGWIVNYINLGDYQQVLNGQYMWLACLAIGQKELVPMKIKDRGKL